MSSFRIEENTEHPGGYALIHVPGQIPEGETSLAIEQPGSDKPYLGINGWQTQSALLNADRIIVSGNQSTLEIGPDIVDHIAEDLRILIRVPAINFETLTFWPAITHSGRATRTVALSPFEQSNLAQKVEAKRSQQAEQPSLAQNASENIPIASIKSTASAPPTGNNAPIIGAIALLLVLMAGGAFWWFQLRPAPIAEAPQQTEINSAQNPPSPSSTDAAPTGTAQPTETPSQAAARPAPMNRRSELQRLNQTASPQDIFNFGRESLREGEREVGYLAVDIAQQRGLAEAMIQMGRWYDPRYHNDERIFSRPNSEQAARYYKRAFEAGLSAGSDELRGLCNSLRRDPPNESPELEAAQALLANTCP